MIKEATSSTTGVVIFAVLLCLTSGWLLNRQPLTETVESVQNSLPTGAGAGEGEGEGEGGRGEREARFKNGDIEIAGTLALPEGTGPFPAVVLISGAGAQDRDGEMFGIRRYVVMSEALTDAGIAVLRTDDRGVGGSTGDSSMARYVDLAEDAWQAVRWLRQQPEIDPDRIGLIGSSQGSAIAPMVATDHPEVAFVVLLSCLGLPGGDVWVDQNVAIAEAMGLDPASKPELVDLFRQALAVVLADRDREDKRDELRRLVYRIDELTPAAMTGTPTMASAIEPRIAVVLTPTFADAIRHDPRPVLGRLKIPTLVISGIRDVQVDPRRHLPEIREALEKAQNPDFETVLLPRLNHFLQPAKTGLPNEYEQIDVAYAPEVLERVTRWISERFVEGV